MGSFSLEVVAVDNRAGLMEFGSRVKGCRQSGPSNEGTNPFASAPKNPFR